MRRRADGRQIQTISGGAWTGSATEVREGAELCGAVVAAGTSVPGESTAASVPSRPRVHPRFACAPPARDSLAGLGARGREKRGKRNHGKWAGDLRRGRVRAVRKRAADVDRGAGPTASARRPGCESRRIGDGRGPCLGDRADPRNVVLHPTLRTARELRGRYLGGPLPERLEKAGGHSGRQEWRKSGYRSSGRCGLFPFDNGAGCTVTLRSVTTTRPRAQATPGRCRHDLAPPGTHSRRTGRRTW